MYNEKEKQIVELLRKEKVETDLASPNYKDIFCSNTIKVDVVSLDLIMKILKESEIKTSAMTPFQVVGILADGSGIAILKSYPRGQVDIPATNKAEFIDHIFELSKQGYNFWNIKDYFFNRPHLARPDGKNLSVPLNWFKSIYYNIHEPQDLHYIELNKK